MYEVGWLLLFVGMPLFTLGVVFAVVAVPLLWRDGHCLHRVRRCR